MALVKSIQQVSIIIAAGSLSNTATINSVDTTKSIVDYGGVTGPLTTVNASTTQGAAVLTNGTTVTASRGVLDASNAITVNATIVEYVSSAIQSIQSGSIALVAATSNTATVSSITTTNGGVIYNGQTSTYTGSTNTVKDAAIVVTNGTTLTASRITGTLTATIFFTLLEFAAGILNSNTQPFSIDIVSTTTGTATISSVTTGKSIILSGSFTSNKASNDEACNPWLTLTNGTTVTQTRQSSGASHTIAYGTVVEFKTADIKSLNRGSIVIATSGTTNTATFTAVDITLSFANFLGFTYALDGSGAFAKSSSKITLTNSTTATASRDTADASNTATSGYEIIEYSPPSIVYQDAWAVPDDVYPYRRKEERYAYPSVAGEALLNSNNFNTVFAQAWADPVDVFAYRRPNNWWIRVAPTYQSNPGTIKILYADAWEVNNFVRFYPKPNYWWTNVKTVYEANPATIRIFYSDAWVVNDFVRFYPRQNYWWTLLPEKYEANPANIGIFYAGAWEVNNQVRYYPAKNLTRQMAHSVMQPELATIGLIFSAAFTTHISEPARAPLNLNFLAINPVISFIETYPALGEYIITLRRRRR